MENVQTIPAGELEMIRLINDRLGCSQGMTKDKIRQVGVVQRHRPQEQSFFFGANPQRYAPVIFNCSSGHGKNPQQLCTHSTGTWKKVRT
jgi:hypothetical protein